MQSLWGVDRVFPCGECMVESLWGVDTVHPCGDLVERSLLGVNAVRLSVGDWTCTCCGPTTKVWIASGGAYRMRCVTQITFLARK